MYDTVNGSLLLDSSSVGKLRPLISKMQSSTINYVAKTETYSGNIQNMLIKINQSSIRFNGSLAKFYNGNNIQSLDINTTKLAIEQLSDAVGIEMKAANIGRLDFAQNLSLSSPPKSYLPLFGETKRLDRLEQGTGIIYRNTRRELSFYDKKKDVLLAKDIIHPAFLKQNLLRYEVRLKGNCHICKYFGIADLTLERLYDPEFYKIVVIAWAREYEQIEKYNNMPVFSDEVYQSPRQFEKQLIYAGIIALGGRKRVMEMLKNARHRGVFKTQYQFHSLQRKVRVLNKVEDLSLKNDLIIEVNSKVKDFVLNTI